ncbi:MAG: winged helix-turn-helix transcriptional regulator [Desulfobacterales bacterium]
MDTQDIRTLKILEEIDKDNTQSQRDLSSKLNISLGLVNSFVKRLANKGYFKITTIPKNRVKYILTPKGALEKTRLTYQYLQYSFEFYRMARRNLRKHFKRLVEQGVERVVFYGVNDVAEIAYISLQETPIKLIAIVDESKTGKIFLGNVVKSPDELQSLSFDKILITFMNKEGSTLEALVKRGIARKDIVILE